MISHELILKKGRKKLVKNCRILQDDRRYYLAFGGEDGYTLEPRRYRVNQGDEKKIREKLDKICNVMNQVNDWNHEHEDADIPEEIWDCIKRINKACEKYQELKQKAQPFLDALEVASEKVWAFINSILARGKETQEHKAPARKRGQDMEI